MSVSISARCTRGRPIQIDRWIVVETQIDRISASSILAKSRPAHVGSNSSHRRFEAAQYRWRVSRLCRAGTVAWPLVNVTGDLFHDLRALGVAPLGAPFSAALITGGARNALRRFVRTLLDLAGKLTPFG